MAVLGLPMAGPVSASTSSIVRPSSCMIWTVAIMACTPMRLATKLGVSLASTIPLPSRFRAQAATPSNTSGAVSAVGISSKSFM